MTPHYFTLITGASSGIGKALAIECAKRGMNLLLISLPCKELDSLVEYIRDKFNVSCNGFGIDLSQHCSSTAVYNWVKENKYPVNVLINNVGVGSKGAFEKLPLDFYVTQIHLNITTTSSLTRLFIDDLKQNAPAHILNTGSMGGFFAMPHKSVYAASKAYIYTFSRSLALELKDYNISVSVLCPGGTDSNPNTTAINADLKGLAKKSILKPEEVASVAIDQMLKKRERIIPGTINKLGYSISRLVPEFVKSYFIRRAFKHVGKHNY